MKAIYAVLLVVIIILAPFACVSQGDGSVDPNASKATADKLAQFATALGDAAIQLEGTKAIQERAPQLLPLLDSNHNGVLELAEITSFQWNKPEDLAAIFLIVEQLLKSRKG